MFPYASFRPPVRLQPLTLSLSPDGSTVAYADDSAGQFNLSTKSVTGGDPCQLTFFTDHTVRRIGWHPDGKQLFFAADREGKENSQIYSLDTAGDDEPQALTNVPGAQHIPALYGNSFSPDGRLFAYVANDRRPEDQDVLVRNLETGEVTRLYAAPGGRMHVGFWSPDSTQLTLVDWIDEHQEHAVYVADWATGKVRRLTVNIGPAMYVPGPWLPDGSGFLVITNLGREFEGLASLDAATGELTWIDTPDWDVEQVQASADGHTVLWTVDVDGLSELRGRDLVTGADLSLPTLPHGESWRMQLSRDGHNAVMLIATAKAPANILHVDVANGALAWVTDFQPEALATVELPQPSLIRYPSPAGGQVPAYIYPSVGATGKVPVVISIHGGPTAQERPNSVYGGVFQYLQSQGIAIFAPNIHGSSGYGITYQTSIYRDWGGVDLKDVDAGVEYLLQQPWVDPDRIALYGGSYGGFVVLSALSRLPHRRFAAAAVYSAPSNLITLAKASPPTWRTFVERIIGNVDTDQDFLMSRSPVTYCENIKAPLMMLQGANDPRVPQSESEQIVERLNGRGVDVDYRVFPDEGHGFGRAANDLALKQAAVDFFTQHLKP